MTIYGYSGENNHFPNLTLMDNTFISGKTFIAGNVSGQRTYIAKDSSAASAGWHGNIVGESGAGTGASLQVINWGDLTTSGVIEIGTPGGTNEMRGKVSSFNFRGSGWIHCHSRIAFDGGTWPNKNDAGTVILYATNNTFGGVTVTQGTVQMGRRLLPGIGHRLNEMCCYYNIPLSHHHAGSDSRACAEILLRYFRSGADPKQFIRTYSLI